MFAFNNAPSHYYFITGIKFLFKRNSELRNELLIFVLGLPILLCQLNSLRWKTVMRSAFPAVADPGLELRGRWGGGFDLLALLPSFPSVISSFFTQKKRGGHPGPLSWIRHCPGYRLKGIQLLCFKFTSSNSLWFTN